MREVARPRARNASLGQVSREVPQQHQPRAVEAALADADLQWRDVEAVAAASSRFSGGKGWGLNGNDVVEDMGSTGVPIYNLSAGCAAGANAFNVGHMMVASGAHDVVLVVGGEKMPKGFIQTSGPRGRDRPRVPAPALHRPARPGLLGAADPAAHGRVRHHGGGSRPGRGQGPPGGDPQRQRALPATSSRWRTCCESNMVSFPLRLYEICPVSDGAAAVVLCSAERSPARRRRVRSGWRAARWRRALRRWPPARPGLRAGDRKTTLPQRGLESRWPRPSMHGRRRARRTSTSSSCRTTPSTTSWPSPRSGGMCEPGESESLLHKGETLPDRQDARSTPSGGFLCLRRGDHRPGASSRSARSAGSCAVRRVSGRCRTRRSGWRRVSARRQRRGDRTEAVADTPPCRVGTRGADPHSSE